MIKNKKVNIYKIIVKEISENNIIKIEKIIISKKSLNLSKVKKLYKDKFNNRIKDIKIIEITETKSFIEYDLFIDILKDDNYIFRKEDIDFNKLSL